MPSRIALLAGCFALALLAGCTGTTAPADGGSDGGYVINPSPLDDCSGGCGQNQYCDKTTKTCVDGCHGACDGGICGKDNAGQFKCSPVVTSCGGTTCAAGQVTCLGGGCACVSATNASEDSCKADAKFCNNGVCLNPKRYQSCNPDKVAISPCPSGTTCSEVFTDEYFCLPGCTATPECQRNEACYMPGGAAVGTCLPIGLFNGQACEVSVLAPDGGAITDGGTTKRAVAPSNLCQLKDAAGKFTETPATMTGTCAYAFLTFHDRQYPIPSCRPPGTAGQYALCKSDYSYTAIATQCGTGLDCAISTSDDTGVCLKACNATPPAPGQTAVPACSAGESCANIYRLQDSDNNAVSGVCMKSCNVFDAALTNCPNYGTVPSSCVPTSPTGDFFVSNDGSGICVPQRAPIAGAGAACSITDPFKGAVCASGQVCGAVNATDATTCLTVCDTECGGANAPARCATEPHATCAGGKTCTKVTSTTGARLGFCK